MTPSGRIAQYIGEVLRGSETPVPRRSEVAAEICAHIDELVRRRMLDGRDEDAAVAEALGAFGEPADIRRVLRRQQRLELRRKRLAEIRSVGVGLAVMVAAIAAFLAVSEAAGTPLRRLVDGLVFFGSMLAVNAVGIVGFAWLLPSVDLVLPRSEFRFVHRSLMWLAVCVVGGVVIMFLLSSLLVLAAPLLTGLHPVLAEQPFFLGREWVRLLLERGGETPAKLLGAAFLIAYCPGAALVQYLRSPRDEALQVTE
jgi:hypothetical protein